MDTQESYKEQVREILEKEGHITSWDAIQRMGNTRLSATIFNLRKEGMHIITRMQMNNGKRFGEYVLVKKEQ